MTPPQTSSVTVVVSSRAQGHNDDGLGNTTLTDTGLDPTVSGHVPRSQIPPNQIGPFCPAA
jgi:hypothetical protein